jgi:hypothetical protein
MKGVKFLTLVAAFVSAIFLVTAAAPKPAQANARRDHLYLCGCGPDCKCDTAKVSPGKCKCGHDLKYGHVVKVEKDVALVCMCEPGCKCVLDAKNPTQCTCGQPLRKASLKGTGLYFCNCGGSCTCNTISDKAGKCGCGMALIKMN